jgi:hypothetical protein
MGKKSNRQDNHDSSFKIGKAVITSEFIGRCLLFGFGIGVVIGIIHFVFYS